MDKRRLGRIGHLTSVLVYGAAALGEATQEQADASLRLALHAGINHLDTAASYGHAEQVMGPAVERVRDQVFLATKTTQRTAEAAWAELQRSLENLRTDHIDLWQVHSCGSFEELDKVFAPGGAIEAFLRAREEGLVNHLGITGHTELAPAVHAEALRRYDFDSVLTPLNYHLYTADAEFADAFDTLYEMCGARDTALRTIKAVARRPWPAQQALTTWYEPFTDAADVRAAIWWVLGTFPEIAGIPTAGDTTLLPAAISAANDPMDPAEAADHLAQITGYASVFA